MRKLSNEWRRNQAAVYLCIIHTYNILCSTCRMFQNRENRVKGRHSRAARGFLGTFCRSHKATQQQQKNCESRRRAHASDMCVREKQKKKGHSTAQTNARAGCCPVPKCHTYLSCTPWINWLKTIVSRPLFVRGGGGTNRHGETNVEKQKHGARGDNTQHVAVRF